MMETTKKLSYDEYIKQIYTISEAKEKIAQETQNAVTYAYEQYLAGHITLPEFINHLIAVHKEEIRCINLFKTTDDIN